MPPFNLRCHHGATFIVPVQSSHRGRHVSYPPIGPLCVSQPSRPLCIRLVAEVCSRLDAASQTDEKLEMQLKTA